MPSHAGPSAQGKFQAVAPDSKWQAVARRAYEIYQARGRTDGSDLDDWLQAERELEEGDSRRSRKG